MDLWVIVVLCTFIGAGGNVQAQEKCVDSEGSAWYEKLGFSISPKNPSALDFNSVIGVATSLVARIPFIGNFLASFAKFSIIFTLYLIEGARKLMSNKAFDLIPLLSLLQAKTSYASASDADDFDFNNEENQMSIPRIIGGESAKPNEFPYQAALFEDKKFLCGCAILSKRHIITAAHCVRNRNTNDLWVRVGSYSLVSGGNVHRISMARIHEKYKGDDYDIALMWTTTNIAFSSRIKPVALPREWPSVNIWEGDVVISGWGQTSITNSATGRRLQKLKMSIVSNERCRERKVSHWKKITERQICAQSKPNTGTCFGDSGGPLVANNVLVGLVSWGSPCALGDPDVFTRIQAFIPWITQSMKNCAADNNDYIDTSTNIQRFGAFDYDTAQPQSTDIAQHQPIELMSVLKNHFTNPLLD